MDHRPLCRPGLLSIGEVACDSHATLESNSRRFDTWQQIQVRIELLIPHIKARTSTELHHI